MKKSGSIFKGLIFISTYFSGMARTAEIVRDARIGEAEANRDAQIEVAIAEEQRLASKLANKTEVERSKRDYEVKKAAYDAEVETVRAEAELAFKLQVIFFETTSFFDLDFPIDFYFKIFDQINFDYIITLINC